LTLADAAGIAAFDMGLEVAASENGTIEMDDAPAGATDTPLGMAGNVISLFQTDCVAIKCTRRTNWQNGRDGGVVVVTGCHYRATT
jgi:hypothetical protein